MFAVLLDPMDCWGPFTKQRLVRQSDDGRAVRCAVANQQMGCHECSNELTTLWRAGQLVKGDATLQDQALVRGIRVDESGEHRRQRCLYRFGKPCKDLVGAQPQRAMQATELLIIRKT